MLLLTNFVALTLGHWHGALVLARGRSGSLLIPTGHAMAEPLAHSPEGTAVPQSPSCPLLVQVGRIRAVPQELCLRLSREEMSRRVTARLGKP